MRFLLPALILFCATSRAQSQSNRVAIIPGPHYDWAGSIALYQDSLLVLAGATMPYDFSYGRGLLNVLDRKLEVKYQIVGDGERPYSSFKSMLVEGDTIVCFGSKRLPYYGGFFDGALFKFYSLDAAPVIYTYGDSLYETFDNCLKIGSCYYGLGETSTNTFEEHDSIHVELDFMATKIAADGQEVWSKHYGTTWQDNMECAVASPDNASILMAGSRWYSDDPFGSIDTSRCLVTLIDTNGNELWQRSFEPFISNFAYGGIYAAAAVRDGFILGGRWNSYPFITKINFDGDTLWSKRFKDIPSFPVSQYRWKLGVIKNIKVLRGGDILLVGRWDNGEGHFTNNMYVNYSTNYGSGFVARYSENGDSIWRYDYIGDGDDYFLDAVEDNLGYIYACGHTMPSANEEGAVLVVKLDAYGCVLESCTMPEPPQPVKPLPSLPFNVFPNPFTNELQFTFYGTSFDQEIQLNVYDAVGKHIFSTRSIATRDAQTINTSSWPNGFYIVELQTNGLVERFKVAKQ